MLARSRQSVGLGAAAVVGALCRDHHGVVTAMIACGKVGARLVVLNTGFSKVQLADIALREGVSALVFDAEFADLLSLVPSTVRRFVAWGPSSDVEELIATNSPDLARFKVPREVVFLSELPRTAALP